MKKVKICLAGATGKMGQAIISEVDNFPELSIISAFIRNKRALKRNIPIYTSFSGIRDACENADIWIDFTTPTAFKSNLPYILKQNIAIVIGTTGWYDRLKIVETQIKEKNLTAIFSPNFSPLVNLQFYFTKISAKVLDPLGYDFGILEEHHEKKVDIPSGTADRLGEIIIQNTHYTEKKFRKKGNVKKKPKELDMASFRLRGTIGDHEIRIRGNNGRMNITTMIYNREELAKGALYSSKWLYENGKPGQIYNFYNDVLKFPQ